MKKQAELTTQDGLLELAGATPLWNWAHPCRIVDCDCRLALILATTDGRDALLERGADVHKAWHAGSDFTRVGSLSADLDVFQLNIDSMDAFLVGSQTPLDVTSQPQARDALERLDGLTPCERDPWRVRLGQRPPVRVRADWRCSRPTLHSAGGF